MMNLFRNDDFGKLLLRLTVGSLMLFHGVAKLLNPGSLKYIASQLAELGLPQFVAYGVFVGEVAAPLLVILGFYARVGGLLIAVNMVFAIVLVHTGELFTLTQNGGWALELQGLFLFGGLAILFLGSGGMAIKRD
jgi:putative oxidoreductase